MECRCTSCDSQRNDLTIKSGTNLYLPMRKDTRSKYSSNSGVCRTSGKKNSETPTWTSMKIWRWENYLFLDELVVVVEVIPGNKWDYKNSDTYSIFITPQFDNIPRYTFSRWLIPFAEAMKI